MRKIWNNIKDVAAFLKVRGIMILCLATILIFFILLFYGHQSYNNIGKEANKIERRVQKRLALLEDYVKEVVNTPVNTWAELKDFPEDMVIYKYNSDTIQFWKNQFPIGNDEVDIYPIWYRLNYLNTKNYYNNPLAYINGQYHFVNLGIGWYLVKVYREGRTKVVSGLLVKNEYLTSNAALVSRINPRLTKNNNIKVSHINMGEGIAVDGADGELLFSVSEEKLSSSNSYNYPMGWLVLLMAVVTICLFYYNHRSFSHYFLFLIGLFLVRLACFKFDDYLSGYNIFSPILYADKGIFSSLGNLLLNNLFVTLAVFGLYLLKRRFINSLSRIEKDIKRDGAILSKEMVIRFAAKGAVYILPFVLMVYIHLTLMSLINNSTIVLELYKLDELSVYTLLAYLSYGFLFIVLLLSMQLAVSITKKTRGLSLLNYKSTIVYILLISIYTISLVYTCGLQKEMDRSRVWISKLSVERDVGLELQLRSVESKIQTDAVISTILSAAENINLNVIKNRLDEFYLRGVSQSYEIKLEICKPNDALMYNQGQYIVDCNENFSKLMQNGVPLSENSYFYFLNNNNGKISYLGIFYVLTPIGIVNLYIELNSRYTKDMQGYPSILFDYKQVDNLSIPYSYSYAKYVDNRLITFRGNYNFPMSIDDTEYKDGYSSFTKGNNLFFVNKGTTGRLVVITRPVRLWLPYLVSFSYLMLFYGGLLFLGLLVRRNNKRIFRIKPIKNSFKRKITYLVIVSLVVALICMGAGSIWFSISFFGENNKLQMEEKLQIVQTTLTDYCKYVNSYTQLHSQDLFSTMDNLGSNIQADINLYDPHGCLIRSTQPELFDKSLISSRMDSDAYYKLIHEKKRQVQNQERVAELSYISLYSPIYNSQGNLIAIANIPYFTKASDLRGSLSSIIATIINVYLLLLITAVLVGGLLSNQLSKPLAAIRSKMKQMDVSKKIEHIDYKSKDEFGLLVGAYNKMVDDLEESTQRLAKTEREHVWSEMARQIAHEIKNPLTPMRLSIQHLIRMKQRNYPGWEDKFEDVANSILEQIEILSNTASEFSSFAKFYFEESTELNLYSLLVEQKILFDTHENIRISFSYSTEEAMIFARKGQIIRVIVNLLSNAIQAVESNDGGYVRISLTQNDGKYYVAFEDNGLGVKPEDESKLFKPNFTTKSSGTGLGLAISQNIIEQSGGLITYSRSEFGGANFTFYLPLAKFSKPAAETEE